MLSLVLALFVSQVPCTPGELSMVCDCKQGKVSACEALRVTHPKLADALERAWLAAQLETAAGSFQKGLGSSGSWNCWLQRSLKVADAWSAAVTLGMLHPGGRREPIGHEHA